MKIAVCFFGHLRTFKRCAPYIKFNLFKHYDCDLFMHTWSDYNHQTKTWHENQPIEGKVSQQEIIDTYGEFKNIIVNDTLRMYKNDDIRMYNFDCITDTIVEVITTCNTYTLLTVHLL